MHEGISRRTLLKRAGQSSGLLLAGGSLEAFLSACGGNVSTPTASPGSSSIASKGLKTPGIFAWGSDYVDGAPYVFKDPNNPKDLVGFEVEVAGALARVMGITQRQVENDFGQLEQALLANRFDAIMNGWEITEDRKKTQVFTDPYYRYGQQIVVHADDPRFKDKTQDSDLTLKDLEGLNVGTGQAYKAADILSSNKAIKVKLYDTNLPFDDLTQKKIDAILIDLPPAAYYVLGSGPGGTPNKALRLVGKTLYNSDYVISLNKSNANTQTLISELNQALQAIKKDGSLRKIYQKWQMWNAEQATIGIQ